MWERPQYLTVQFDIYQMRDLGKARQRSIKTHINFQKQRPISIIGEQQSRYKANSQQIYNKLIVFNSQNNSNNMQQRMNEIQQTDYRIRKTVCTNVISSQQENIPKSPPTIQTYLQIKPIDLQIKQIKRSEVMTEQIKALKPQIRNSTILPVQQNYLARLIPANSSIKQNKVNDVASQRKAIAKLMQYQKFNTQISSINMMRSQILKYLFNGFRGWVFQMTDQQIKILYEEIARQRSHFQNKTQKYLALQNQRNQKKLQQQKCIRQLCQNEQNNRYQESKKQNQKMAKQANCKQAKDKNFISLISSESSAQQQSENFIVRLQHFDPEIKDKKKNKPFQRYQKKCSRLNIESEAKIISYYQYQDYSMGSTPINSSTSNSYEIEPKIKIKKKQKVTKKGNRSYAKQETHEQNGIYREPRKRVHLDAACSQKQIKDDEKIEKLRNESQQIENMISFCTTTLKSLAQQLKHVSETK